MSDALAAALWLVQFVPVFPVLENKRPACPGGFKAAKRTAAEVRALWSLYPGVLAGMPTGEASGISVLDLDFNHGAAAWLGEHREGLGATRVHQTRSGGQHWLYKHRKGIRNTQSKIGPGVDSRGTGGYVVAWHCHGFPVWNDGLLADWPGWLFDLVAKKPAPPPAPPMSAVEADARALDLIARVVEKVRLARPGRRHYALLAAARTLGGLSRYLGSPPGDVQRLLVDMAMAAGGEDRNNAELTAAWAFEEGRKAPLLRVTDPFEGLPL